MTKITLTDLDTCETLAAERMGAIAGGLTPDLQFRLNQFGAQLHARGQYLFNPYVIYSTIRTSQQAWRRNYGRQMPYFFPMPRW
ncbi:MAG: hypothetical protein AAF648_12195 [Pseudomonadota bacterium]